MFKLHQKLVYSTRSFEDITFYYQISRSGVTPLKQELKPYFFATSFFFFLMKIGSKIYIIFFKFLVVKPIFEEVITLDGSNFCFSGVTPEYKIW